MLILKSELTENRWRIYADNIAMARWLQETVQGMLNPELADTSIPVVEAEFSKSGDPRYFWTERVVSYDEDSQSCAASSGNWQVELKFANDPNSGATYNGDQDIKVNNNGNRFKYKLKDTFNPGRFPYTVWFKPASGDAYPMADPELEIEM